MSATGSTVEIAPERPPFVGPPEVRSTERCGGLRDRGPSERACPDGLFPTG